jgi:hypothetical protein
MTYMNMEIEGLASHGKRYGICIEKISVGHPTDRSVCLFRNFNVLSGMLPRMVKNLGL